MTLTQLFLDELDREAVRTRRTVERVPSGRDEWKPHAKSMALGRLAGLVASMPSWISLIIGQDELDLTPPGGGGQYQQPSPGTLAAALDHRRISADDEMASEGGRSDRVERAATHRAARYAQSPRAPPRPADGVSPPARPAGAGHLRAVGGRSAVCVTGGRTRPALPAYFLPVPSARFVSVSMRPFTTAPSATETCGEVMSPSTDPVSRISTRLAAVIVPVTEPRTVTLRAAISALI